MTTRTPRRLRRSILASAVIVAAVAALPPAASAGPTAAYNEPSFTKTSANNSFWFNWNKRQSYDASGNPVDAYYLCFTTYKDGVLVENHNGGNGPGSTNCTGYLAGSSGNYGVMPFAGPSTVLQEGSSYYMCVIPYFHYGFGLTWTADTPSACTNSTTIDRSNPSATVYTNGTDTYTNNPTLHHRIDYSDTISPAWLGVGSLAANYRCIKLGSPCTASDTFTYDPNCSTRTMAAFSKTNQFFCDTNVSAQPDGTWYFCAKAADAAIPDNTAGTNQFTYSNGQPVTSDTANISAAGCGSIILDRVPPTVTATPSSTNVTVGQLVNFSASASDDRSGVGSGAYTWSFGDNTSNATGANVSHTYTQPGSYEAATTKLDNAGNTGTGKVVINVTAAPPGDSDGDGISDSTDSCPTQSDTAAPRSPRTGCPAGATPSADGDGDGISDSTDSCPTQSDTAAPQSPRNGCPAGAKPSADGDGDGISDSMDSCPTQSDTAAPQSPRNGCPAGAKPDPDRDGDGIRDAVDGCPDVAAATLTGCPAQGPQPTGGNDILSGNALANTICGLLGNDSITGLGGNDTLWGDACGDFGAQAGTDGDDKLNGSDGNDALYGAGGRDTLTGGKGADKLFGGAGNDALYGVGGRDTLKGDKGADKLLGGDGNDTLSGGAGKDSLDGGKGNDKLTGGGDVNGYKGGAGDDTVNAKNGKKETVDCGGGRTDKATVDKADKVKGCEKVTRR